MTPATFSRQRARIERRFPVGAKRERALSHLVRDAKATTIILSRGVVGWRMTSGEVVCVKRRYGSPDKALGELFHINAVSDRSHVPVRLYQCEQCGGFHLTSQRRNT